MTRISFLSFATEKVKRVYLQKPLKYSIMKELLCALITEDGEIEVFTDFEFEEASGRGRAVIDRNSTLFKGLANTLRDSSPDILYAIQLLDAARREARYDCSHLHPELEAALSQWRRQKASELGYSVFVVLQQSVLLKIADAAPKTEEALLAIPGFGHGKFGLYGQDILSITNSI